jgi:tetratricopeptide (TPR) repeat protein
MGIVALIIFCITLAYYLGRYAIRLVVYLKKAAGRQGAGASDEDVQLDIPDEIIAIVFPGGAAEIEREVKKLHLRLKMAHPEELVRLVLVGTAVFFSRSTDKSEGKMIAYIQEISPSVLSPKESKIIHDFIYARALRIGLGLAEGDAHFKDFIDDTKELTGCDADEIPGGSGPFGLTPDNPIPVKGIISNEYYLGRLRTQQGERITWERIGSRTSPLLSQPVDIYQIMNLEDVEIARLYISPYHKRVSNKAPAGFKLLAEADLAATATGKPRDESPAPAAAYPVAQDQEPAAVIVTTTDEAGNEEALVYDPRLLSAATSLMETSAALMIPDPEKAAIHLKAAIAELDSFPGPDDAQTIDLLRSAARLSGESGEPDTAERLLDRALKALLKSKKTDQQVLSDTQYDLGVLLYTQRNFARAETLIRQALLVRQQLPGPNHENKAKALLALALVLEQGPPNEEEEGLLRQALPLYRRIYGEDHPDTAFVLDHLVRLLVKRNKTDEALPLAEKTYAIRQKVHGPQSKVTALSMSTLAIIYKRQGRLEEAENLQRQLLAILEKAVGTGHEAFGTELGNLAGTLIEKGDEAEAMALFYQALYVKEESLSPQHPSIAHTLSNLAGLHAKNGELAKAEPLAKRAFQIRNQAFGDLHPETQQSFHLWQRIRADKRQ